MNKKNISILIFVLIVVLLIIWGRSADPTKAIVSSWKENGVECLPNGHQNLAQHIHQTLKISVDGVPEVVPAKVGVMENCMAEIHTHEANGVIHIETIEADQKFLLGNFMKVYGKEYNRVGFMTEMKVNGKSSSDGQNLMLSEGQVIEINYKSATN